MSRDKIGTQKYTRTISKPASNILSVIGTMLNTGTRAMCNAL